MRNVKACQGTTIRFNLEVIERFTLGQFYLPRVTKTTAYHTSKRGEQEQERNTQVKSEPVRARVRARAGPRIKRAHTPPDEMASLMHHVTSHQQKQWRPFAIFYCYPSSNINSGELILWFVIITERSHEPNAFHSSQARPIKRVFFKHPHHKFLS